MRISCLLLSFMIAVVIGIIVMDTFCAEAIEKKIDIETTDIYRLSFNDVLESRDLIDALYEMKVTKDISIGGKEIALELYSIKNDELIYYENIPKSIVIVKSDIKTTKLPITSYRPLTDIIYVIPATEKLVLGIRDPSGGNCWNCNQYYVIALEDKYFLKNIGKASRWVNVDNDEFDELIIYEDSWEVGLGYLSHADAPGAEMILSIKDGELVTDISGHKRYYKSEIERIDNEIEKYPTMIPTEFNPRLLSLILQKFLIYKLLDDMEGGWREFDEDIRHYDDEFFYLCRSTKCVIENDDLVNHRGSAVEQWTVSRIPISEIIEKMKASLVSN